MILFIYVPGFYAAVEQADDGSLRGHPLIVGGDPRKHGSVTSASIEARDAGITAGMPVAEALEVVPGATLRATRLKRYREVSAEMRAMLRNEHERIEELGPDGTFLELADGVDAVSVAAELIVRLQAELGVAAVAGVGPTRFVAFLAAQYPGAGGLRLVREDEALAFLGEFPVTEIWGLGPATAEKLAEHSIGRIADLQSMPVDALQQIVGRSAAGFLELALAEDAEPLRAKPRPKSVSQERTLPEPTVDLRTLGDEVGALADRIEAILARERRAGSTVTLGIHFIDGTQLTRTQSLGTPVAAGVAIAEIGEQLLSRAQAGVRRVRRLKLQVSNLSGAGEPSEERQLRLF